MGKNTIHDSNSRKNIIQSTSAISLCSCISSVRTLFAMQDLLSTYRHHFHLHLLPFYALVLRSHPTPPPAVLMADLHIDNIISPESTTCLCLPAVELSKAAAFFGVAAYLMTSPKGSPAQNTLNKTLVASQSCSLYNIQDSSQDEVIKKMEYRAPVVNLIVIFDDTESFSFSLVNSLYNELFLYYLYQHNVKE